MEFPAWKDSHVTLTQTAPPRRRLVLVGGVVAALLVVLGAGLAYFSGDDGPQHPVVRTDPVNHEVLYEVTGTAAATAPVITWVTGERNATEQAVNVPLPWKSSITLPVGPSGGYAAVEVRSAATGAGSLSCRMFADGVQVAQQVATDGFAGVACSHRIPPEYVK